jgi:hypothetical protein
MSSRTVVLAARTSLLMLLIAAVALLSLGAVSVVLADPPEVDGWLRSVFGRVFGIVAAGMAIVLGAPAAIGLWAMAGARDEGVVPALPQVARRALGGVAIATVITTAVVLLVTGSAVTVLNLALLGLVALGTLGLAGADSASPHRWRATLSGVALVLVVAGTLWVLGRAFLGP